MLERSSSPFACATAVATIRVTASAALDPAMASVGDTAWLFSARSFR